MRVLEKEFNISDFDFKKHKAKRAVKKFCGEVGPDNVISITGDMRHNTNHHVNVGIYTVWYKK